MRVAEENSKKAEARRIAKADIKPELFLQSEEEMLRRFRKAIIASNKNSRPKKNRDQSNKKQSSDGFTSIPPVSRLSQKSRAQSNAAPENAEHFEASEYVQ